VISTITEGTISISHPASLSAQTTISQISFLQVDTPGVRRLTLIADQEV
jgi:hypothetical protein